jgi:hypothetical protein
MSAEVKECVEIHLHSPIRLHGVVLYLYGTDMIEVIKRTNEKDREKSGRRTDHKDAIRKTVDKRKEYEITQVKKRHQRNRAESAAVPLT